MDGLRPGFAPAGEVVAEAVLAGDDLDRDQVSVEAGPGAGATGGDPLADGVGVAAEGEPPELATRLIETALADEAMREVVALPGRVVADEVGDAGPPRPFGGEHRVVGEREAVDRGCPPVLDDRREDRGHGEEADGPGDAPARFGLGRATGRLEAARGGPGCRPV